MKVQTKSLLIGLIVSGVLSLAIPHDCEAGILRRLLARRAGPRSAAVNVQVGRAGVSVAVQRGAAVQPNRGVRRGFGGGFRRGR